jgi:hypothetical protein
MKTFNAQRIAQYEQPLPKALIRYLDEEARKLEPQPLRYSSFYAPPEEADPHPLRTVSLRRRWAKLMTFVPTDEQFCDAAEYMVRALSAGRKLLGFGMVVMILYLAIEIGSAFLPQGAVARVLGGGQ